MNTYTLEFFARYDDESAKYPGQEMDWSRVKVRELIEYWISELKKNFVRVYKTEHGYRNSTFVVDIKENPEHTPTGKVFYKLTIQTEAAPGIAEDLLLKIYKGESRADDLHDAWTGFEQFFQLTGADIMDNWLTEDGQPTKTSEHEHDYVMVPGAQVFQADGGLVAEHECTFCKKRVYKHLEIVR